MAHDNPGAAARAHRLWPGVALLLGTGMAGNGLFMLAAPMRWYFAVPGVTSTGAFNQHFIRDIGMIYVFSGLAFGIGAVRLAARAWLWGAASVWLLAHALFHGWEVAVGICGLDALPRDFAGVTLPAILGALLSAWAYRARAATR